MQFKSNMFTGFYDQSIGKLGGPFGMSTVSLRFDRGVHCAIDSTTVCVG
ncbi:MAG: hypothetical protein NT128_07825 [Proteobacteria bacterium]|nr:hypothetical protein [Pseudomonadota bacterium]